jgi:hypothetical protein
MAAQHRLHTIGAAFKGHMGDVDLGFAGEFGKGQVWRGAIARRPIGELARVGFGKSHQVGNRLDGRVGPYHHTKGVAGQAGDVGEIFERVELHLHHVGQTRDADGDLRKRIAVGLGTHQLVGAEHAAGAGFVFDDHLNAQRLGGALGQSAHHSIRRSACRPRANQFDGLGRKGLGLG